MPWNKPSASVNGIHRGREFGTITDVIKQRTDMWKPKKSELYTTLPVNRFSRTTYPDTRFVTHPIPDDTVDSYMDEQRRFKTTSLSFSIYNRPDADALPHLQDRMKSMANREFRVKRLQMRLGEMDTRKQLSEEAGEKFTEEKIARKALTLLNYERKIRASCI